MGGLQTLVTRAAEVIQSYGLEFNTKKDSQSVH